MDFPCTIRTTMQPDTDVVVDEPNYLDLLRQGLILPGYEGDYDGEIPDPDQRAARMAENQE